MTCQECDLVSNKGGELLYEDQIAYVVLAEKPAAEGHIIVYPKKHTVSTDSLTKEELEHLLQVGNICASALFDTLGSQGTNVLMNEGDLFNKHLSVNIIARKQGDELDFNWKPKELPPEKMESAMSGIKNRTDLIGMEAPVPEQTKEPKVISDEQNPLIQHLKRKIP